MKHAEVPMPRENIQRIFLKLSPPQQARVLAQLALNLTVCARAAYPGQIEDSQAATKLRAFNELQHTITGRLAHLTAEDDRRYPDDVFLDVLFEKSEMGQCQSNLLWAFENALDQQMQSSTPVSPISQLS